MMFNLKKNITVGVSVTPGIGLEVAQIDIATKTVLKYASKPLAYDHTRREIADLDIFKETLQEIFEELQIPKGADVSVNIPTVLFNAVDYPASLNEEQIMIAIEEDLSNHPIFQNTEGCISATALPNSTIQFTKIAYTVAQKTMLIELAIQIKELGYNLINIDTSVNSTLSALIYNERVNISPDFSWLMLMVENNHCRILSMLGKNYVDCFEEKISIGEVLEESENYSTVIETISPILKNIPSQCLYIVSKTDVISAEKLASKLLYNAPIIHQEANKYSTAPFLEVDPSIDEYSASLISLDVIGAAINRDFPSELITHFNLFNESLGDVYLLEQPFTYVFAGKKLVFSIENMIIASLIAAAALVLLCLGILIPANTTLSQKNAQLQSLNNEIMTIQKFLNDNSNISTETFDEGDEIRMGLASNKNIFSYYTIVGTEIPKKLWLTALNFGQYTTIEGQADNLESVYAFFRNIKDYNPESNLKLQKLGLAAKSKLKAVNDDGNFDTDSIINSMNADFYEFKISNAPEEKKKDKDSKTPNGLPDLEPIE